MKKLCLSILLLVAAAASAQLPDSDIWLYEVKRTAVTLILHKGGNITKRPGYDNQPFFTPDSKSLLFVSVKEDGQSDVYRYELKNKKTVQLTKSATSEYSPLYSPDGKRLSVLMVEFDSTQRVWCYNTDGTLPQLLTEKEDSIGYYSWLSSDSILFYKLSDPVSLHAYRLSTGEDVKIADNVTRGFGAAEKKQFFYVVKSETENTVRLYDPRLKKSIAYATAKTSNEDFAWDKNLGLIKSEGSKLMRYSDEIHTWVELADLSGAGITKITRFAISKNGRYLAVVSNK